MRFILKTTDFVLKLMGVVLKTVSFILKQVQVCAVGRGSAAEAHAAPAGDAGTVPAADAHPATVAEDSRAAEPTVGAGEAKYPSTQHLPFSPGLGDGDTQLSESACGLFFEGSPLLVLTEKLDGGNCCVKHSEVYARTHKHPARHPWFDTLIQLGSAMKLSVTERHASSTHTHDSSPKSRAVRGEHDSDPLDQLRYSELIFLPVWCTEAWSLVQLG